MARKDHALSALRPGLVNLSDIYGVDVEKGTFQCHPDFPQEKTYVRPEVMDSLASAPDPASIPPIALYLHKDGKVVVLKGRHRIMNALKKCAGDPNSPWAKIKADRYNGSVQEAQIWALTADLSVGTGLLNEAEEVGVIERLTKLGLDRDELITKVGRGNTRWVNKILKILDATPDVLAAVKSGEISIETGSKIADHVDVEDQAEVVENIKKKGDGVEARKEAGLRKERIKLASVSVMWTKLWEIYEEVQEYWGTGKLDDETEGRWNILKVYFGFVKPNAEHDYDHDAIMEKLKPMYEEYCEKQNNPRGRGRPKKS